MKRDGDRISEVIVANKDGLVRIRPRVVIDCTGDGDVAAWSGAPVVKTEPLQPMTLHFRIGNVKRTPTCPAAVQGPTRSPPTRPAN